ncbi:MAG TPA: hypothetical protein VGK50_05400 [Coriobacteriia bacterium]|jgi:hypothetical protein
MNDFWSAWPWPLATALLGFVFTWLVFRQWLARRKPHQLAWTVGLLFYSVAAVMESWSEYVQHWDPTVYRVYIVLAASLVGFLGLGSLYLIVHRRVWGHVYLTFNLVCMAVFLYGTFTTPLRGRLAAGITVGGSALGAATSFPRIMSLPFNIPGSFFLLGGALLSVWRFAGKREYRYRMWANVLIALGTVVIAFVGGKARAGSTVGLYPAEMVASALLLWGFLLAGTLEKGARAAGAARRASRVPETMAPADEAPPPAEAR